MKKKRTCLNNLGINQISFKIGIAMSILIVIIELIKSVMKSSNYESIFNMITIYYILMVIVYVFGLITLFVMSINISKVAEVHRGYFIFSIISTIVLAIMWIPHYDILSAFFELGNMTSDNMEYMYNFSMSVYDVISDLNSLNGAMFMFVINGIIHRIISYVVTPQNVNTIESKKTYTSKPTINFNNKKAVSIIPFNCIDLYKQINTSQIKNRVDAFYWIFDIETLIKKENDINKRYLKIKIFNRMMNENNNLMRLYLNINGQEIYEDYFEKIPEYNNENLLSIVVERDLAEEQFEVEITGYILNGNKSIPKGSYISNIEIKEDNQLLSALKEKYFYQSNNNCNNLPIINDEYWLCTCGYINDVKSTKCSKCGIQKKQIEKMVTFNAQDLLKNISSNIEITINQTIDEIIENNCNKYYELYNIDKEKTRAAFDRNLLNQRQLKYIDDTIQNILDKYPIKFIKDVPLEEIIRNYCKKHTVGIITEDMIYEKINHEQYFQLYQQFLKERKLKSRKIRRNMLIGIPLLLLSIFFVFILSNFYSQSKDTSNTINYDEEYNNEYNETLEDYIPSEDNGLIEYTDYIFEDSNSRYLEDWELENLSQYELKIARCEIYARHGYDFDEPEVYDYFLEKDWYYPEISPDDWNDDYLNEYEQANINLISNYE